MKLFVRAINLFAALTICVSVGAESNFGEIVYDITVNDSKTTYEWSAEDQAYMARKSESRQFGRLFGRGAFRGTQEQIDEENSLIIGEDIQGYSKLRFEREGDKFFLYDEFNFQLISDNGLTLNVEGSEKYEVVIVNGTWEQYEEGEEIELEYTEASRERAAEVAAQFLVDGLQEGLNSTLPSHLSVVSERPNVEFSDLGSVLASKEKIERILAKSRFRGKIAVNQ